MTRTVSRWTRGAVLASILAGGVMAAGHTRAQGVADQQGELGYSYLHLSIRGKQISNLVHNAQYAGWLTVEDVEIGRQITGKPANDGLPIKPSHDHPRGDPNWTEFSAALRSGRHGPGKLNFGAGDDGGFDPAFDALKRKTLIPEAALDFYDSDTAKFVGKYKIRRIRVLSLKDAAASACPMYDVTLSFQSIEKE
jgi:hypothetical protein